ncbi:AP-4 complex accessory subunit RUSC2 isoform X1 [Phyllopteryx taeniolatus]|uniref:AP-4 complex accessory subunit RUSC2 isoform X1 n=1 Tax=Phyllopteryx taeniolatus TaxID=161469 RepID=UPI002AD30F37|nr:AP-4 complex accessory subunit RUSC2 isoform X1 [Phyllopteryx taeniolatus]XP_061622913.1 AP-4 complex accessory subunit RUSC2 isoform X1 [Phyllopteryx taeniolatus]
MDGPPKLSGETLIVHHIPLMHCQVSGRRQRGCGVGTGSLKRTNPFSPLENLGLSRTTSLPERDILQREALLYSSLIQTSTHNVGPERQDGGGGSTASNDSSFTSSISDEQLVAAHTLPRIKTRSHQPLRRNPFLIKTDDEEEDDDDDGNLSGYHEDSSFHLHSHTTTVSFHLHDLGFAPEARNRNGATRDLDPPELGWRHGSSGSNMSVDCGEHEWEDDEDGDHPMPCTRSSKMGSYSSGLSAQHCSCCTQAQNLSLDFPQDFPNTFPECPQGYSSDSSCNSSDGVLVNFSTIYSKMNNSVPEKQGNLNSPAEHPPTVDQRDPTGGVFYLDLLTSPSEPPLAFPLGREPPVSAFSANSCSTEHQAALELDANCNSYCPPSCVSAGGAMSCLQSEARLVVATQNYYKLVTCDLSSQSSPSPAGSSVHSGSEEHSRGSPPSPTQPSEYFLFRQRANQEVEDEGEDEESTRRHLAAKDDEDEDENAVGDPDAPPVLLQGQVYVNMSPPLVNQGAPEAAAGRPRSRSYDRNLDKSPGPRLGSLERMLSCPVRLSEGAGALAAPPPPRVTSFAEIARSKRRHGGSPSLKADPFSSTEFSPIHESNAASKAPTAACCGQDAARESDAEGGPSSSSDIHPAVVRYSKDQRPTTLPIQPFTFHHQLASKPPQPKPLLPLLTGYVSGMQARSNSNSGNEEEESEDAAGNEHHQGGVNRAAAPPGSVRPSPLGSYSPVHLQEEAASSRTCSTCTPSPPPPPHNNLSCCPQSTAHTGPLLPHTPPPASLGVKRGMMPPTLPPVHRDTLSPLGCVKAGCLVEGSKAARMQNAYHLSPQALKWREYRRQNPLGGERVASVSASSDSHCPPRKNVFDFPSAPPSQPTGPHHVRQMQQSYGNFLPDYFSLTERPPEEFCLSPDASTASSLCFSSGSQSHVCVDMTHKRGLVKAVNTAVDLIVAHFGTNRDPDVKAKLGNSWVSPNVGHLILKYLCPALYEVLQDGLKAYVLDLIIGQRRCQPWSLVEASTQLGPSTRVLHNLLTKVSQFSELTNHSMRLNAFIFGLLNLKSLEFWFSHLLTHEDIIAAHYNAWGLVPLAQGACQQLFSELLLLLQPLSLLPFDLDLLFEPRLLATGREQQRRRKELLCSARQSTTHSTLQLMRGWGAAVGDMVAGKERVPLGREETWPRTEVFRRESIPVGGGHGSKERGTGGQRMKGVGQGIEEKDVGKDTLGKDPTRTDEGRQRQDRQAGWWYQLMQSSQVYIDQSTEGSKFVKADKRRTSAERRPCRLPLAREGVVDGAESGSEGRPSWMGSPPESVLNQEATVGSSPVIKDRPEIAVQRQGLRWGRLFGSSVGSPTKIDGSELRAKAQKSRQPSGWLGLDSSVLGLMAQTIGAGGMKKVEPVSANPRTVAASPNETRPNETKFSTCEVRALCHHIATEAGQLSFNKGDVLRVLSKADAEWLLCSTGASQGLVPIVYVSLCSMEESQDCGSGEGGSDRGCSGNGDIGQGGGCSGSGGSNGGGGACGAGNRK